MTPEQIIEMAKKAVCYDKHDKLFWGDVGQIQAFAQLVRNAALEECASACQSWGNPSSITYLGSACRAAASRIQGLKS